MGMGSLGFLFQVKYTALMALVLQNTLLVVFMRYSRVQEGPRYATSTAVVCMEVMKLVTCLGVIFFESGKDVRQWVATVRADTWDNPMEVHTCAHIYTLKHKHTYKQTNSFSHTPLSLPLLPTTPSSMPITTQLPRTSPCPPPPLQVVKIAVPSLLYTIQNNLLYYALSHLDTPTYMVGYQTKILTTAVFSALLLGRKLSRTQVMHICTPTVCARV